MKKNKTLPTFSTEEEEREFWAVHDAPDYIDFDKADKAVFPDLKPSTRAISIRLPEMMIEKLKVLANKKDVPYQSLIKIFLAERLAEEQAGSRHRS